jgi:hypothetical protein
VSTKQCKDISLPKPQNEQKIKNQCMNVNSNPTASPQNKKKLTVQKFFPFIYLYF